MKTTSRRNHDICLHVIRTSKRRRTGSGGKVYDPRVRTPILAVTLALICATATVAQAEDVETLTKANYPTELVQRPLLLIPDMFEVRFGVASNFLSSGAAGDTERFLTKTDFIYGLSTRFQFGVETELAAVPSDEFAVNDAVGWLEYSLAPAINIRAGGFTRALRDADGDLDTAFGVRAGLPMKLAAGGSLAIVALPRFAFIDGDKIADATVNAQLQIASRFALFGGAGVSTVDFSFDDGEWQLPFNAGVNLALTRKIDVTAEALFADLANDSDQLWMFIFFSFRG